MKFQNFSLENIGQKRRLSIAICFSLFLLIVLSVAVFHATNVGANKSCVSRVPVPVTGPTTVLPALPGIILINEILPTPGFQWNCSSTTADPGDPSNAWIELYNPQNITFDLYAARLFIDTRPGTPFSKVPFGAAIAPHSFLILFPFTDFQLMATTIRLRVGDTIIDSVSFSSLGKDISYARQSDGSPVWTVSEHPTIDASNTPTLDTPTSKATATPKPTPTLKPTPTPRPQTGDNQSTSAGRPSGTPTNTDDATPMPLIDGTQPDWHTLAIVSTRSALSESPTAVVPAKRSQSASSLPQPATMSDLPRKIVLTLLAVALTAALLWSYWLFSVPGSGG